jgi:hypothetical protein
MRLWIPRMTRRTTNGLFEKDGSHRRPLISCVTAALIGLVRLHSATYNLG